MTDHTTADAVAAIKGILKGKGHSYLKRDADEMISIYIQDEKEFLNYDMMVPYHYGVKSNVQAGREFIDAVDGPLSIDYDDPVVEVSGGSAFSYSILKIDLKMTNGQRVYTLCRQTDIWKFVDGKWSIVVEMNSAPIRAVETAETLGALPGMPVS